MQLSSIVSGVLDLLLPRHCAVSGRPLLADEPGPVAPEVLRSVEVCGADYCTRCGAPQGAGVGVISGCTACEAYRDGFGTREIVAVGEYGGALRELCLALKFGGERAIAKPLAAWLAPMLEARGLLSKVEAIVPMPLHALREFRRGYNQAALIANELAALTGKPVWNALRRLRHTQRQALQSAAQRKGNVDGAFAVRDTFKVRIEGKRLLLLDDVMTTGATLGEAARTLKRADAPVIYGAIAGRATPGGDD